MMLLTPDLPPQRHDDKKLVFLAGPIMGAENWQQRAIADLADLDIYIANPRREKSDNFNYDRQVEWETFYLSRADVVMFWLPLEAQHVEGRSYAQTSRSANGWGAPILTAVPAKRRWSALKTVFRAKAIFASVVKTVRAKCLTAIGRQWRKCVAVWNAAVGSFLPPTLISVPNGP